MNLLRLLGLRNLVNLARPVNPMKLGCVGWGAPPRRGGARHRLVSWLRSSRRAAREPIEVGREGRELGDDPACRPRFESVEKRRGRPQVLGCAAQQLPAREARSGVAAAPATDQDLEQPLEIQRARRRRPLPTRGTEVTGPRHVGLQPFLLGRCEPS